MGEPLNNYDAVLASIRGMSDSRMFKLSPRHITLSTVGVVSRMKQLTLDAPETQLALSLHAPNQARGVLELMLCDPPSGVEGPIVSSVSSCLLPRASGPIVSVRLHRSSIIWLDRRSRNWSIDRMIRLSIV